MNEYEIDKIVHDYVSNNGSEDELSLLKSDYPNVDWDGLIKEESLINSMFQAKEYANLELKISNDIDKLEKRLLTKKVVITVAIVVGIISASYYIFRSTNHEVDKRDKTQKKEANLNEVKTVSLKKSTKEKHMSPVPKLVKAENKPLNISLKPMHKNEDTVEIVTINLVKDQILNEEPNVEKQEVFNTPKLLVKEEKEVLKKEIKEKTEPIKESDDTIAIRESVVNENYIINPSMYNHLKLESFGSPVTLSIRSLKGEMIYDQFYEEDEAIVWEGKDFNENTLPVGLYIYQIYNEQKMIQFGQITISR